jgi:hypothetical protein
MGSWESKEESEEVNFRCKDGDSRECNDISFAYYDEGKTLSSAESVKKFFGRKLFFLQNFQFKVT